MINAQCGLARCLHPFLMLTSEVHLRSSKIHRFLLFLDYAVLHRVLNAGDRSIDKVFTRLIFIIIH